MKSIVLFVIPIDFVELIMIIFSNNFTFSYSLPKNYLGEGVRESLWLRTSRHLLVLRQQ